ncbi:diaminopimelate epimerase [Methylocaldum sp.]|uniref:diaminopimelate epimerase n=1 Tax=Methylocaldum sp. TaxID=1969727 RepID=UPI002D71FA80|nr:diaminopimelate epimerase [Methylocaldum sp.]HYE34351.1 diaminopimelate epimerase [Methylocaldum sp.]
MALKFTKMHGLGNDFVVIDGVRQNVSLTPEKVRRIANRHFGVGCDQVLVVETPVSSNADFRYRIFNADGGEVAQCGNGARCFARFVRDHGLCDKDEIVVDTDAGQLRLVYRGDGLVTVNMGIPRHAPAEIPLDITEEAVLYEVEADGKLWPFGAVSMGNPHAVLKVDDVDHAPVEILGPHLESHPIFPQRANIGFAQVIDRHHIRLRVFERGSGETLACGSGACAASVAGIEQGDLSSPVQVDLSGGSLNISWEGRGRPVFMTGPAVCVFEGEIDL